MKVFELKYCSKRFKYLKEKELQVVSHGLLFKIFVMTGWQMSDIEEAQDVLVDQFKKKLVESYADCNVEEVEYAFRNYSSYVKDWGKQMNLSMIDEVMAPFLTVRASVSRIEESVKKELPPVQESLSDEAMREWLNNIKMDPRVEFMPVMLYDWAEKKGLINYSTEHKKEFYLQAINKKFNELLAAAQDFSKASYKLTEDQHKLAAFTQMRFNNKFSDEEKKGLISSAKKIALFNFINSNEYLKTIV